MKILHVSSEVSPFAKTGGLGDVLGALPRAQAKLGHEVKVCMPRYASINAEKHNLIPSGWEAAVDIAGREFKATASRVKDSRKKIEYLFIENAHYFGRTELYRDNETGKDYTDNDDRFSFFCRAVLSLLQKIGWKPDIIHIHDWQAALIPSLLKANPEAYKFYADSKTCLTIHNLGYQGIFEAERFARLNLPEEYNYAAAGPFEFWGKVNFLKSAITLSDIVTTVSPRYAKEICQNDEFGCGLEGVLSEIDPPVRGILNGADYTIWSPTRDKDIPHKFSAANLSGKRDCKAELMKECGLPMREWTPVIGMISRLADQKGWDLLEEAAEDLFVMNIQMVVLGTGDKKYHDLLLSLEKKFPDQLKAFLDFDDALAHRIEAGSDIFLMPSRYEPCGLNQIYSLKYGTVPVVRKVGGLADTVIDYDRKDGTGTGFLFEEYTSEAMLLAIARAVELFSSKRSWSALVRNGMKANFSWQVAALEYIKAYQS